MAFCRNCGSEIPEGDKFCMNCGRAAEQTPFGKFSKFIGIILLLISIVDFFSDPPFLTIVLSIIIIAGAIFCLSQKYRLKGFTIVALLIAVICLFAGISQGSKFGFFKVPQSDDYEKASGNVSVENNTPSIQIEKADDTTKDITESEIIVDEETEKVNGVDPELKAFLDSYEQFMDEYIAFMKKYTDDPGNAIAMIGEYASIMEKYGEFAEAVDKYDEKEMSTEDAKYYLEVTTRINQKMLEIY